MALTEHGTMNSAKLLTGIDHLIELGVTHVHLLPSYDYASVDETKLDENKYNWGYDPQNYNVPDGSYATDPYDPAVRIREFKQMVQALHKAGIRVVLDVVYNHTYNTDGSNFERTVPGYFYRQKPDGSLANGSACGNETASNRPMMRKYMIESVLHWIREYHIDGFRFDLMGIHDIETMNEIRKAVSAVDPSIIIYGEGWAAEAPQYPGDSLAMKVNTCKMPGIAAFSDEIRDALRGPFNDNHKGAFLAGIPGEEESIKFGIVGAVSHPQVNNDSVNYSKAPWASQPTQMISYVSCHDDMCLVDRLKSSIPGITPEQLVRLDKLAQTAVLTSQGIPFIYAGEEVMRDKKEKNINITLKNEQGTTKIVKDAGMEILGAAFKELPDDLKKQLNLGYGLQVTGVTSGKMADAGVRKGFIILKANDQPMRKVSDLEEVMKAAVKSPNQVLFLTGVFPSGKRGYYAVDLTQE